MNLRFVFLVAFVVFVATPSLEFIGARAQTPATAEECRRACNAASSGNEAALLGFNNARIRVCDCVCPGLNGGGPLHATVRRGCGHCFFLLTNGGGNCPCDDRDRSGNTPLHNAARGCSGPMTDRALTAGCNANARNNARFTPLCEVSRRTFGDMCGQVVRTLLRRGATPCLPCPRETACRICGFPGTCDILEQENACNCR